MDDRNYIELLNKLMEMSASINTVQNDLGHIKEDIAEIKVEDAKQNGLLAEHIQGVKTNAARLCLEVEVREKQGVELKTNLMTLDKRVSSIETFPNALRLVVKSIIAAGSIAAAIWAIDRIWDII